MHGTEDKQTPGNALAVSANMVRLRRVAAWLCVAG
jgi:hypothetical protein